MPWLLNTIYLCLLTLLSPAIVWRMLRHGRYRRGLSEKLLGRLPQLANNDRPVVWFHAVSVGEVLQLQTVVREFRDATRDQFQVLITTSTDTGYDLAVQRFHDCTVSWFPLDFSWAVSRALQRVRPEIVVLAELEFWPGFLTACRRHQVRTAVINARMSDRSFRGYSRIPWLIRPLLQHFAVVAAQSAEYAKRLIALGAQPKRTIVTGSIKFDGVTTDRTNHATQKLRQLFQIRDHETVLIAGSTQAPEERMVWDKWRHLRADDPQLRLIIVPRHPERFDAIADQLKQDNIPFVRRSALRDDGHTGAQESVILLDTIGELSACWGLADIAFVGGSFGNRGGQNMLEPAAYGAAVLFGPNTWNFRDIVRLLLARQAAIQVATPTEFGETLDRLLQNPQQRRKTGSTAQQLVLEQRGAVQHSVQLLAAAVDSSCEVSSRTAA